ncbi:MAG TPA: 2-C-methyl-D-erythritol 4-phosphate cytidylyltransferase [Terriglobia bacterium]|nr:2-C-methyl-D-erythritol 4-phosphate cytidylyltransferase [Terriglobia bacterium]
MSVTAIIAAAGAGRRMKSDRPKQLLTLQNTPILIYTVRKFDACRLIERILVAAPQESVDEVRRLVAGAGFSKPVSVVQGGARRQDSVAVAMQHLSPDTTIVTVHDAVRPFVRVDEIEAVIAQAQKSGAAVLAIPIVDTVKQIRKDVIDSTLTREHLVLAQTPQAFRIEVLREAFERARRDEYYGTDESSLVERLGLPVAVVRGSERNIKITRPDDLALAQFFLQEEQKKP